MNLTITPVGVQSHKNNQQNFGIKMAQMRHIDETLPIPTFVRQKRDIVMDIFESHANKIAKETGVNLKALDEKNMTLDFIPKYPNSSKMTAFLKDKNGEVVQNQGYPVFVDVKRDTSEIGARNFVKQVGELLKVNA